LNTVFGIFKEIFGVFRTLKSDPLPRIATETIDENGGCNVDVNVQKRA